MALGILKEGEGMHGSGFPKKSGGFWVWAKVSQSVYKETFRGSCRDLSNNLMYGVLGSESVKQL